MPSGSVEFLSKCVKPSRVFLSRILDFMRALPNRGKFPITSDLRADLFWWSRFMPSYNGISLIPKPHWSQVDGILATDACPTGCGGGNLLTRQFFHVQFPDSVLRQNWHINELELMAIMVAIKLWGSHLAGERLRMYCDNTVAVAAMNQARVRNGNLQKCMREIAYWLARHECELYTLHIEGVHNRLPDMLSRWHLEDRYRLEFLGHNNVERLHECIVPEELFGFTAEWC